MFAVPLCCIQTLVNHPVLKNTITQEQMWKLQHSLLLFSKLHTWNTFNMKYKWYIITVPTFQAYLVWIMNKYMRKQLATLFSATLSINNCSVSPIPYWPLKIVLYFLIQWRGSNNKLIMSSTWSCLILALSRINGLSKSPVIITAELFSVFKPDLFSSTWTNVLHCCCCLSSSVHPRFMSPLLGVKGLLLCQYNCFSARSILQLTLWLPKYVYCTK